MTEIASISSSPGILYQIVYFQSKDRIHGSLVGTNWQNDRMLWVSGSFTSSQDRIIYV